MSFGRLRKKKGKPLADIYARKWEIPIFGYVTATLATFFIGREAATEETDLAGVQSLKALQDEIQALRAEIRAAGSRDANI